MVPKVELAMLLMFIQHCIAVVEDSCSSAASPAKGLGLMQVRKESSMAARPVAASRLGDASCPCIGIDGIIGETTVVVSGSTRTTYPLDTGAHCEAWDNKSDPVSCMEGQAPGAGRGWCNQSWCYVDPCSCNLDLKPKRSSYLPDGMYQGKPLYFSYATCGGKDTWSAEQKHEVKEADASMCEKSDDDSQISGKHECKCIGINGEEGSAEFIVSGTPMQFPADAGTKCGAWDLESNPECHGNSTQIPAWCAKRWCFVDPCSCPLEVAPKQSSYLLYARVGGKPVYFSYDTCGDADVWTAENHKHACVNQKSQKACKTLAKCGWDAGKNECLGKHLLEACSASTKRLLKTADVLHDSLDENRRKTSETTVGKAVQQVAEADSAMKVAKAVEKAARKAKDRSAAEAANAKATEHAAASKSLADNKTVYTRSKNVARINTRITNVTAEAEAAKISEERLAAEVTKKETDLARSLDTLNHLEAQEKQAKEMVEAAKSTEKDLKHAVKTAEEAVEAAAAAENDTAFKAAEKKIDEMFSLEKLEKLKAALQKAFGEAKETQRVAEHAARQAHKAKSGEHAAAAREVTDKQAFSKASANLEDAKNADRMVEAKFESMYGNPKCPCIGIDNITGSTTVVLHGTPVQYPADAGAHCAAWDDGREPLSCLEGGTPGGGHGWCAQSWCYVDPCNCDLEQKPKATSYLPDGRYQGKPVHFSYSTCGGKDTWSAEQKHEVKAVDKAMCEKKDYDFEAVGRNECKCIGIEGEDGSTEFLVSGKTIAFPANAGTECGAWDLESNPECSGNLTEIPAWCAKRWCFVDPCSCALDVPPKTSSYLPHARVGGKSVYFSYDTCGDEDVWTAKNHKHACVNQKSEKACQKLAKCGWDVQKSKCLGKDLLEECKHPDPIKSTITTTRIPKQLQDVAKDLAAMLTPATSMLAAVAHVVAQYW